MIDRIPSYTVHRLPFSSVVTYWSAFLGCDVEHLTSSGIVLVPHLVENSYEGYYVFHRGEGCVITVFAKAPASLFQRIEREIGSLGPGDVFAREFWESRFVGEYKRVMGPAFIGYVSAESFRPAEAHSARLLEPARRDDAGALRRLFAECSVEEWEHSGIQFEHESIYGVFAGERLVAAASYELWTDVIAHIGVITAPDYRGQGLGTSVVSAVTRDCLGKSLVPQYRTLFSNFGAMGIARQLGFGEYAQTMSITINDSD